MALINIISPKSSYTETSESSQSSGDVNYGPYTETAPFSVNNIKIHFENNIPFAVFKKVTQKIEVTPQKHNYNNI